MGFIFCMIVLCAGTTLVVAQPSETFEVAILKPSRPETRMTSTSDRAQFVCTHHTLQHMIMSAWRDIEIQPWKLSGGPSWLTKEYWDLSARLPPNMPTDQQPLYRRTEAMLRIFLAEEFGLKVHRDVREEQVYALIVGKGGPKLKPSEAGQLSIKFRNGAVEFHNALIGNLVSILYDRDGLGKRGADRPVIDKTGLAGFFDFTLAWTPDNVLQDPNATSPSLYTALQEQLGLKLQLQKLPVDYLVIDQAERPVEH